MSTEKEAKYSSIISNYEMQLVESNDAVRKLSEERTFLVNTLNELQLERDTLGHQLSSESTHLERKLDCLGKENERMRKSMQSLNDLCGEQQRKIKELSKCLDERCSSNEKQSQKKTEELKRLRQSLNLSQEKVKYWQLKHQTDLEELKKSKEKELETIKSNNDQLTNRNGELSRSNSELRKKVQQLENDIKELNEKLNMSKHSLEAANKHKKELKEELDRSSFNYKKEINVLEQLRDEYIKKNTCQQQSIEQMLEQINKFKDDLEELIKRNQTLNEKIVKLNSNCEAYKKKYSEIKFYLKKVLSEENISLFNQSTDQIEKAKQPSEIDSKQMNVLGKLLNELNLNGANLENNQEEPSK
jgi:chromosome segregation ATPase